MYEMDIRYFPTSKQSSRSCAISAGEDFALLRKVLPAPMNIFSK